MSDDETPAPVRSPRTLRVGPARTVAYGPADRGTADWALRFTTADAERVTVRLDEAAMYELWTEVHNTPWPRDGTEAGDLRREVAALAEGASVERLREVLAVLRGEDR